MAKKYLYQIYDNCAMTVVGIIMSSTRAEAMIREFTEVLANKDTTIGKYPEDYSLLELGVQNQDTGEIEPYPDPKIVYTGRVWLRLTQREANPDSSSPANTNGAGEQPSGFLNEPTEARPFGGNDYQDDATVRPIRSL